MSKLLSLLVAALFVFDATTLVAARPQSLQFHSDSPPVDVKGLNTNTKRFAAGLPPLPPAVRRWPTGVDTAKRAVGSQCAKSGVIQVINVDTSASIGYISATLTAGQHYGLVGTTATAATFSSSVFTSGTTTQLNILDTGVTGTNPAYLAGLVQPNAILGNGDTEADAVVLGRSDLTNPGDTPQANKNPSFPGRDAETAIWTYNFADNSLTATWVNYAGQTPASETAYASYVANTDEFYLTNSRTAPANAVPVVFLYISVNDGCGSN